LLGLVKNSAFRLVWGMSKRVFPPERIRLIQLDLGGRMLIVPRNEDVGRQLYLFRSYERRESTFIRNRIRPTDICFDVGANIGYYATLMAQAAPSGEVHSFEPVPLNWHLLSLNVLINGFQNVMSNNIALGDRQGRVAFSAASDGAYSSMVPTGRRSESARIEVEVDTLDAYIHARGIKRVDVLKVDVEGAEGLVLQGARRLLSDPARRPRITMLELFDANHVPYQTSIGEIIRQMAEFGYSPKIVDPGGRLIDFERCHWNVRPNVFFVGAGVSL
jgi:FkbM family methyltransferase